MKASALFLQSLTPNGFLCHRQPSSTGRRATATILCIWSLAFVPCKLFATTVRIPSDETVSNSCYYGAYTVIKPPFNSCSGYRDCETGHYCENGMKSACPAGTFGASTRLSNSSCSGACFPGFYCPVGSTRGDVLPCGDASVYCPAGSSVPLKVPEGYYSITGGTPISSTAIAMEARRSAILQCPLGHWCSGGVKRECNGGTYGNEIGIGYRQVASSELSQFEGIVEDSSTGTGRTVVNGSIGDVGGGACSGKCPEGWYCPPGTVLPFTFPCGKSARNFCPEGTSRRIPTGAGYYAVQPHSDAGGGFGARELCPRGSYCVDGVRTLCPAGRYGATVQMSNASCSGACSPGFYCPAGSVVARAFECEDTGSYCPTGSGRPIPVSPGYYTLGGEDTAANNETVVVTVLQFGGRGGGDTVATRLGVTRSAQAICELGFYCLPDGIKRPCPVGRYGSVRGLKTASCSGFCEPGFYCEEGSPSATQHECGGPHVFCPPGSANPQSVQSGYYSVLLSENGTTRTSERRCEPGFYCREGVKTLCDSGHFGDQFGQAMSNCSGLCAPGFYCPLGSTRAQEVMCGDPDRYCPEGSPRPLQVHTGYYSIGGNESTRSAQEVSPWGHFASRGLLYPCPAGTYGDTQGLASATCSGYCNVPGFYCPTGSISPRMRVCGGDHVFCPISTVAPIPVNPGFYTADYLYETCPPGKWRNLTFPVTDYTQPPESSSLFFDSNSTTTAPLRNASTSSPIHQRHSIPYCELCPEGTYKSTVGDDFSLCLACDADNSVSSDDRIDCRCTTVTNGSYTAFFNISTGKCERLFIEGVVSLKDASEWDEDTALTRYREFPCEPGHFCVNGQRFNCPAGYYGSRAQETRPLCEGLCAPGYFCLEASTSPFSYPCGSANYICPEGSPAPKKVAVGYYSNEDAPEQLRSRESICPVGYTCPEAAPGEADNLAFSSLALSSDGSAPAEQQYEEVEEALGRRARRRAAEITETIEMERNRELLIDGSSSSSSTGVLLSTGFMDFGGGRRYPCPAGTYTDQEGTTDPQCLGLCDRGYYCEAGSPSRTQFRCGNSSVFCPRGSAAPQIVYPGFYSIFTGPDAGAQAFWGNSMTGNSTASAVLPCEPGYYCIDGVKYPCAPGSFGWRFGMSTAECGGKCAPGYYCPSFLNPQADAPAYTVWPRRPHSAAAELECGDVRYFCPRGTAYPIAVGGGNYSIGGDSHNRTRSAQRVCSPGSYCSGGISILCPPGLFGSTPGLASPDCTGICPPGFYCPSGAVEPIRCPPNQYSTGKLPLCSECPGGRTSALPCQNEVGCCNRGGV